MGAPHVRQEVHNTAAGTQRIVVSNNSDSNHFNVIETVSKNGNAHISSDLVDKKITRTDSVSYTHGNNMQECNSNNALYVNGRQETVSSSSYRIIGSADLVHQGLQTTANNAKAEVVAARSDFGDNRFEAESGSESSEQEGLSKNAEKTASSTPDDICDTAMMSSIMPAVNLLQQLAFDTVNIIGDYATKLGQAASAAGSNLASLISENKSEKDERQNKKIEELPDGPAKQRILSGQSNCSNPVYENPASNLRNKTKTFDEQSYQAKVANYTEATLETESRMC